MGLFLYFIDYPVAVYRVYCLLLIRKFIFRRRCLRCEPRNLIEALKVIEPVQTRGMGYKTDRKVEVNLIRQTASTGCLRNRDATQ